MASPHVNPPRGMRDFLPAEKRRRERVLATIRRVYAEHGFDEIETPVVEDSGRLHSGMGGDNEKLSFAIERRGLTSDDLAHAAESGDPLELSDLGLRFDLTVPLARFVATHRGVLPGVFRSLQIGPVWRAERPQKGRFRQFVQCDIDIIGEPGMLAEAELLTAGSAALRALDLADCTIRVNDRRLLAGIVAGCGFADADAARVLIEIDKLDKIGAAGVVAELGEIDPEAAQRLGGALAGWEVRLAAGIPLDEAQILASLPEALRDDARPIAAELAALDGAIGDAALPLRFDPTLVRGMGYYTGTIFEVAHPASGSSVGGGGRYDGMIGRFLGDDIPACGFSIGFERIVDLVEDAGGGEEERVALLVDRRLPFGDAIALKRALLAPNRAVRLERRPKNLRALLERLEAEGFTHVVHAHPGDEADPGRLKLERLGA